MLYLHSKVTGDIESAKKKISKKSSSIPTGNIAQWEMILTSDCVPFDYNRDTKSEWCSSTLAKEGAFDWQLFGVIEGIRNLKTNKVEIWDGLGRLALAQFSNITQIPVIIHDAGSAEAGALFVKKQKSRNRSLNQESHFVAGCSVITKGGTIDKKTDTSLKNELRVLSAIGARVEGGVDTFYPTTADPAKHPKIKINALRRALVIANQDVSTLKAARDFIVFAYGAEVELGKELFEGATLMFAACPAATKNGTFKSLCNFLKSMNGIPQGKLPFKKLGGNQHNDEARSVAFGFLEMFKVSTFGQGTPSTVIRDKHIAEFKRPSQADE
jgi:hypothetical protein